VSKITAYHLTSKGLEPVTEDQLVSIWKAGDDPGWLDAVDAPEAWVKKVLAKVGASPLIEHAIFKRPTLATSLVVGDAVYFRVPVLLESQDAPVYLHALAIPKLLITWRSDEVKELKDFIDAMKSPTDTPWVSTLPDLVASLCSMLSMDAFQESQRLLHSLNEMSDEADKTGEISRGLNTADRRLHAGVRAAPRRGHLLRSSPGCPRAYLERDQQHVGGHTVGARLLQPTEHAP
jgi:hypothetical protein